jgi:hypothetical protein
VYPIQTRESNFAFLGPNKDIADLPCRVDQTKRDTFSVWELTQEERQMIAQGANIRVGVYGMLPIPPFSLQVVSNAGPYERIDCPCRVCGAQAGDAVHQSGPSAHAFKMHRRPDQEFVPAPVPLLALAID